VASEHLSQFALVPLETIARCCRVFKVGLLYHYIPTLLGWTRTKILPRIQRSKTDEELEGTFIGPTLQFKKKIRRFEASLGVILLSCGPSLPRVTLTARLNRGVCCPAD